MGSNVGSWLKLRSTITVRVSTASKTARPGVSSRLESQPNAGAVRPFYIEASSNLEVMISQIDTALGLKIP